MTDTAQCGSTELHAPHDACAGLSEYDHIVRVGCPDCMAPAGAPCRFSTAPRDGDAWPATAVHGGRRDLAFTDRGTCKLCGLLLLHDTRTDRVWHPVSITDACPPMPDPATAWNLYAAAVQSGQVPGEPGIDNFVPQSEQPIEVGDVLAQLVHPDTTVLAQTDDAVRSHIADAAAETAGFKHPENDDVRRCRECGCTDLAACDPPCTWVDLDLCSGCGS